MNRTHFGLLSRAATVALACAAAWASETSATLVADARRKLRAGDSAAALQTLAEAVAADARDSDAQVAYQDLLRTSQPEKDVAARYRAAADARPDDALAAYLAVRCLRADEALRQSTALQTKFPASPWPHVARADALAALGKHDDADAAFAAAIAASPQDAALRVMQARGQEAAGRWSQASDAWALALSLRPKDQRILLGLGEAMRRAGRPEEAVARFDAAAKADPRDPEPAYRTGLVHVDARRWDQALKAFDAALALDKSYADAYAAAARCALAKQQSIAVSEGRDLRAADFKTAIDYGTRAVAACAKSPTAHLALAAAQEGAAEYADGHAEAAAVEYDAAASLFPPLDRRRGLALAGKAHALLLAEQFDAAAAAASQAIAADPSIADAYLTGARALEMKGAFAEAIKTYYSPGVKALPDEPALRHARGLAYWDLDKRSDARRDLEAAVKAAPADGRYLLTLGEMYYHLEMYPQSLEKLLAAADRRPDDASLWRALARTSTSLKQWDKAAAAFEEVVRIVEGPRAPPPGAGGGEAPNGGAPAPAPEQPAAPVAPPGKATSEHLQLAYLYAEYLNDLERAKTHARKWREQGGKNDNLDDWVTNLLEG